MAEPLRELVVALSLEKAISRATCAACNQQIKEAESTFHLAGAGVENLGGMTIIMPPGGINQKYVL